MKYNNEILKYMGHKGEVDARLDALIFSSLEKLKEVSNPLYVKMELPCTVNGNCVKIDSINIKSEGLAVYLNNCTKVYIFAATLGTAVDRLITQRTKVDSVQALCVQACATAEIEDYCNSIEQELSQNELPQHTFGNKMYLLRRFSPGYSDFSITHQTDILRLLQAQKRICVTETEAHMLTPLKSVTGVIGISTEMTMCRQYAVPKCTDCENTDCIFRVR
jgi:5-methyltetrahydrofolate--homocysteine methyltransferase